MTEPTPQPALPVYPPSAPAPAGPPPGPAIPDLTVPPPASPVPVAPPRRRRGMSGVVVAVLVPVLLVAMFAGGVVFARSGVLDTLPAASPAASAQANSPDAELALIDQAWKDIQDNYVDAKNLDNKQMAYAAIRAMTEAVGDSGHTSFLTADEAKAVDQSLSGSFVGIGVQVNQDAQKQVTISSVIPGTPAEEAGLRRGDHILAVDGKTTTGETLDQTVARVRGPEGEQVTLTIGRDGSANFDVTITRRKFDLPLISWAKVPGTDVALIRLEQFATGATDALKKAITDARAGGARKIIFDLRGNPGGYVNEAVGVASQFVGDGVVYQAFDRSGKQQDAQVQPGGLATDIPIVVLADGDTASSAEIVTGAIQDAKRGEVVGVKTFGTGTVLGRFDLADGSQLRIGTERWLTRNGRPIWHEGLEPDVNVTLPDNTGYLVPNALQEMTADQVAKAPDVQFLKALQLIEAQS